MRTVAFRAILWAIAYKLGLDPEQGNFQTNQAIPIGTYIDEWVRRTYSTRDWPEWTVVHQFMPEDHVVTWDALAVDLLTDPIGDGPSLPTLVSIGRVLQVYVVDPAMTDSPVSTRFEIRANGIHVGMQHGTYVWIEYIAPAPKFTAVTWQAATTYQKDDVTYSYTTGECYSSKVDDNIGNNPASGLKPPPPQVIRTEQWIPDNPGVIEQNKIAYLPFTDPDMAIDDIPPSGTFFSIVVISDATDNNSSVLSTVVHTADGIETLADVITAIAAALSTDLVPLGFLVTGDTDAETITFEHDSNFGFEKHTIWTTPDGKLRYWKAFQIQSYIPASAAVDGQLQVSRVTMNDQSTVPGALYKLIVTDSMGGKHNAEYQSSRFDSSAQILQGLVQAVEAIDDVYFRTSYFTLDPDNRILDIAINDGASIEVQPEVDGSAWWELVPFPKAIADQVIRGAYSDLLKEWGQTDKGMAEEQIVPVEAQISETTYSPTPNPELTGQQRSFSRYKIQ